MEELCCKAEQRNGAEDEGKGWSFHCGFFFKWEVVYADEFDPAVSEEEIHDVGVQAAEGVRFLSR